MTESLSARNFLILMVGRLGLEPRTKALKGFYQRPLLSLRVS
jgi:hypothetical protein